MKASIMVVTLLHVILPNIEGSRWNTHKASTGQTYELSLKSNQPLFLPLIILTIQQANNPGNIDISDALFGGRERFSPKNIGRAHIREIHDIRHDPEFSSHYYMNRRMKRCHARRRLCIYGECNDSDIECVHECRVRFHACYHLPSFDDKYPAFPKMKPMKAVQSEDITFESIMSGNL